jgi:Ca2+-binding RTX toxin-like protein
VGNLVDYLHFEVVGGDTVLHISTTGAFSSGFDPNLADQRIIFTGVDLVDGLATDQEVIARLLANGNLIVDQETTATDPLNGITTFGAVITDNDGDTASTSISFDTRDPAAPDPDNDAPVVQADSTALLGLIGANVLDVIQLGNQAFIAGDPNGDLRSVTVNFQGLAIPLGDLRLTASRKLANDLGLTFTVESTAGIGATSTLTITALDGGNIDNLAVNELLATVRLESDINLLGLVPGLDISVLGTLSITATDSHGLSDTDQVTELLNANVLDGLLAPSGNPDIIEGASADDNLASSVLGTTHERLYGFEGDDVLSGGSGNDLLRGGSGNDVLDGGDGNDVLIDGNGEDTFLAGSGDDIIIVSGTGFAQIDGGDGSDILRLDGNLGLDLTSADSGITNIERIDLGNGASVLTLTEEAVLALTDDDDTLQITGEADDRVNLVDATYIDNVTIDGITFAQYELGSATVLVDEEINNAAVV